MRVQDVIQVLIPYTRQAKHVTDDVSAPWADLLTSHLCLCLSVFESSSRIFKGES